jgi:hypothetical protein
MYLLVHTVYATWFFRGKSEYYPIILDLGGSLQYSEEPAIIPQSVSLESIPCAQSLFSEDPV